MALININNNYIKILKDGSFIMYRSQVDREIEKLSPSSDEVISFYKNKLVANEEDIINLLRQYDIFEIPTDEELEQIKKDHAEIGDLLNFRSEIEKEYYSYTDELFQLKGSSNEYPIAQSALGNVNGSIPYILSRGRNFKLNSNLETDAYNKVKISGDFGPVIDC